MGAEERYQEGAVLCLRITVDNGVTVNSGILHVRFLPLPSSCCWFHRAMATGPTISLDTLSHVVHGLLEFGEVRHFLITSCVDKLSLPPPFLPFLSLSLIVIVACGAKTSQQPLHAVGILQ